MSSDEFAHAGRLNDEFRKSRKNVNDDVIWPPDLVLRGAEFREEVLRSIIAQDEFSDDNPLHDHGFVRVRGETMSWNIENRSAKGEIVANPVHAAQKTLFVE